MACIGNCASGLLTQGISVGCQKSTGGVSKVWITNLCNIDSQTVTSGLVTAMTLSAGEAFYKFEFARDGASYEEPAAINLQNGTTFYEPKVSLTIPRRELSKRNVIELLANKRFAIIVLDQNGNYHYFGGTNSTFQSGGMELSAQGGGSGTAKGDLNGYTLEFTGSEADMGYSIDAPVIALLPV